MEAGHQYRLHGSKEREKKGKNVMELVLDMLTKLQLKSVNVNRLRASSHGAAGLQSSEPDEDGK